VDKPFGGCILITCGDTWQIRSIQASLLSDNINTNTEEGLFTQHGINLYRYHCKVFYFTSSQRHKGDQQYLEILNAIRAKKVSEEQVELLRTRLACNLDDEEFSQAILICPRNKTVDEFNLDSVRIFSDDVLSIPPDTDDDAPASLIEKYTLHVAIGAPVTLTVNVSVRLGLFNGSTGTLVSGLFDISNNRINTQVLFVRFLGQNCDEVEENCIPCFRLYEKVNFGGKFYRVGQFPLALLFAQSVYKSQGKTLDRCQTYLDKKEIYPGQSYTQLSRVRNLKDIVILDHSISSHRFNDFAFIRDIEEERREAERLNISDLIYNNGTRA